MQREPDMMVNGDLEAWLLAGQKKAFLRPLTYGANGKRGLAMPACEVPSLGERLKMQKHDIPDPVGTTDVRGT